MTFQKTQPSPLDLPGVGGVARSNLESVKHQSTKLMIPTRICANCGTASAAPTMPGNGWIEAILWMYIVPGLIYSIWRRSRKSTVCPACNSKNTVPLDTPAGKRLTTRHYPAGIEPEEIEVMPATKSSPIVIIGGLILLGYFLLKMLP